MNTMFGVAQLSRLPNLVVTFGALERRLPQTLLVFTAISIAPSQKATIMTAKLRNRRRSS